MGVMIAAALTTVVALMAAVVLLTRGADRRALGLAFVIALPLEPLSVIFVRGPLDAALHALFGATPVLMALSTLYAPCTEEPAKWLTAVVPSVYDAIKRRPVAMALAVGLGFGIGEIWLIAYAVVSAPNYPDVPFWMFDGFLVERLEVCFLHGVFVALPFVMIARHRPFWIGGLAGVTLHFLVNLPIFLARQDAFGLGAHAWTVVLTLWTPAFVVGGALMLWVLARLPAQSSAPP